MPATMTRSKSRRDRILIHIDEQRRDVPVCLALGRLFEQAGYGVVFSTRRTTPLWLREQPFDAILTPFLQHLPYDLLPTLRARSKIYVVPTEGAQIGEWPVFTHFAGGVDPSRWDAQIASATRVFLWGDYSRRMLQGTGRFRDDQLLVVGAPRMDSFLMGPPTEVRPFGSPSSLGAVTHLSLTNSYNLFDIFRVVDQARGCHNIHFAASRNLEDWYWIETAQVRVWLELFDACRRRNLPIWLRVHPREDLRSYRTLHQRYGSVVSLEGQTLTFQSWLERIGILTGFNSTTFFEAVAMGKPAISLDGLLGSRLAEHRDGFSMSRYPILDYVAQPHSWDEVFDFVERVRQGRWSAQSAYGPAVTELLKDLYTYPRAFSALTRIVQIVDEDLRQGGGPEPARRAGGRFTGVRAKALERMTFGVRGDRVTSAWFPLALRRLERAFAADIARYLRAAERFPATRQDDSAARQLAHEHSAAV